MSATDVDSYDIERDAAVRALSHDARRLYRHLLKVGHDRGGTFRQVTGRDMTAYRHKLACAPGVVDELVDAGLLFFADSDPAALARAALTDPAGYSPASEASSDAVIAQRVYEVLTTRERDAQDLIAETWSPPCVTTDE